jgi:glycosyltransferase involved in cell wall biosynthesis
MTDKPFFSVIIPTYNRAKFIGLTIHSLLQQDFKDFELIVVDDGSTDNTEEIVSEIKDDRLTYFKKKNAERAAARNFGAQHARGRYINFFDSDDLAYPHHLSTASIFINMNVDVEIFHLGYDIKSASGVLMKKVDQVKDINQHIITGNFLSCNGVFIRHDVILRNQFNEDRVLSSLEDWELWIRMASRYSFKHFPQITSTVVNHDERSVLTSDIEKIKNKAAQFIQHVFADAANKETFGQKLNQASASAKTYVALHLAMAKANKREIWKYLKDGVSDYPGEILKKRFLVIIKLMLGL